MNTELNHSTFANFDYLFFDLFFCLFYDFFNPRRVNASIRNKSLQRKPGYFSSQWIKRRKDNRFRRVIYNEVNTGGSFDSPDISALPSNYLPFDLVTFQVKYRD